MTSSGTTSFFLSNADVVLEAYDRCELRPSALTSEHMVSARNSLNLELTSSWSNQGLNLWQIDLQTIPMVQGVATYTLPSDTVAMLDTYFETYQLPTMVNIAVSLTTTQQSPVVAINQSQHGLSPGNWISIVTQVSIGGIILSGFYQVANVLSANAFTIISSTLATSSATGGAVPQFSAVFGSSIITCSLNNHGLNQGNTFNVNVATLVGGIPVSGPYTVLSATTNTFTFNALYAAASTASIFENNGLLQMNQQSATVQPVDRILLPISRTDYAQYPDKLVQAPSTVYWFDRLLVPQVTVWQVPDGNGPYALKYYRMKRIQDSTFANGQTPEIPDRFLDALCACLATRLSIKYAKAMYPLLKTVSDEAIKLAHTEDRERVELHVNLDMNGYYNMM